jgi:hypothetical protein
MLTQVIYNTAAYKASKVTLVTLRHTLKIHRRTYMASLPPLQTPSFLRVRLGCDEAALGLDAALHMLTFSTSRPMHGCVPHKCWFKFCLLSRVCNASLIRTGAIFQHICCLIDHGLLQKVEK